MRLIEEAQRQGKERLKLVMQTICATGIRVSELAFIRAEAVKAGRAEVSCKNKNAHCLSSGEAAADFEGVYEKNHRIADGPVFITRGKRALNRSNIWAAMKKALRKGRR